MRYFGCVRHVRHSDYLFLCFLPLALLSITTCSSADKVDTSGVLHLPALDHYEIILSPDVDSMTALAEEEAVKQWSNYAGANITVRAGTWTPFCVPYCFALYEKDFSEFNDLIDGSYVGYTIPSFIFIARGLGWDELQDTVIHEDGHMLGLEHRALPIMSVMNPSYGHFDHVMCDDAQVFMSERPDAGLPPLPCTDAPGALDESADGGPAVTP